MRPALMLAATAMLLSAWGESAELPAEAGVGPDPRLPPPRQTMIPTVKIAKVVGWGDGATPVAADGLRVTAFARGLEHPRWLLVLPNGDVLVAESAAPPRPDDNSGVKGWIAGLLMSRAGAARPSANRITLLRDADGDGVAEFRAALIEGLNSPIGMALVGDALYVAATDAVLRFPYRDGDTRIAAPGVKVADLPAGRRNHHWTKTLVASPDGARLYVGVGSNSNAGEHGIAEEEGRAAIWEIDAASGARRVFASGLRNPVGLAFEPSTRALWSVVNERDELGSDLVPDYLTSVRDGGFYGFPYSYWGRHPDPRVAQQRPDQVVGAITPDYALGNHVAPLGLAFADGARLPERFRDGAFVGEHGSWNRDPPSGYRVVFVPFSAGRPAGMPVEALGGFLDAEGNARGRPVGVAIDRSGGLLVADDVGDAVWRVAGR